MKKIIFLMAFVVLSMAAFSQNDSVKVDNQSTFRPFRLGVFGSVGISSMKPKNKAYTKEGSRLYANWGLLFDYNLTENYTLSTGFNLASMGGKLQYNTVYNQDTGMLTRSYQIKYINLPLLLKMKTNQMGYMTYFFQVGLLNGFRLSAYGDDEFRGQGGGNGVYTETDVNLIDSDETALYRLSWLISIGGEYEISKTFGAFAYIGYENGLINALKDNNPIDHSKANAVINNFFLTAGFLF